MDRQDGCAREGTPASRPLEKLVGIMVELWKSATSGKKGRGRHKLDSR